MKPQRTAHHSALSNRPTKIRNREIEESIAKCAVVRSVRCGWPNGYANLVNIAPSRPAVHSLRERLEPATSAVPAATAKKKNDKNDDEYRGGVHLNGSAA